MGGEVGVVTRKEGVLVVDVVMTRVVGEVGVVTIRKVWWENRCGYCKRVLKEVGVVKASRCSRYRITGVHCNMNCA